MHDQIYLVMPSPFEKIEARYLDRIVHTHDAAFSSADIADLIAKHPELQPNEIEAIETFFKEHGTLIGISFKYRED